MKPETHTPQPLAATQAVTTRTTKAVAIAATITVVLAATMAASMATKPLHAQNLVPNGGFEDSWLMPDHQGEFGEVVDWMNTNGDHGGGSYGTPDYYHKQAVGADITPPNTYAAKASPAEGMAMAGIMTYKGWRKDFREYITIMLLEPLQVGQDYNISMKVSSGLPPYYANYATNGLGIGLSTESPAQTEAEPLGLEPQWLMNEPLYTEQWKEVAFTLTADKPYLHLTIGNFLPDRLLTKKQVSTQGHDCAYYFIDDVRVSPRTPDPNYEPGIVAVKPPIPNDRLFDLDTLEDGDRLVLPNLQFAQSEHTLNAAAMKTLDSLHATMVYYPKMVIELMGFTSNEGDPYLNRLLSIRRVEEARSYLAAKGIPPERVRVAGHGEKYSRFDNRTVEGRVKNRRVEIRIIRR